MARLTNAERQARFRARATGRLLPVPGCPMCGRAVLAGDKHAGLCVHCWREHTVEGREEATERMRRSRRKHKKGEAEQPPLSS